MALSLGIVGLPNVGKSTLFNALLSKQQALAANYPFATIDPNVGIVDVPDERLRTLGEVIKEVEKMDHLPPEVPATVSFVDIAGLVKGASEGEGLGNKFLANIRETNAICHVLRAFEDDNIVREGAVSPIEDLEIIRTELMMADLATLEKQKEPKGKVEKTDEFRWSAVQKLKQGIEQGRMGFAIALSDDELLGARELFLLTMKPELFVLNVREDELADGAEKQNAFVEEMKTGGNPIDVSQVVIISAKVEAELAELEAEEKEEYLASLGLERSGLERLIESGYTTLNLMSFLTAGEMEIRAWTIRRGTSAPDAAGVIHNDFRDKFIKAKVVQFDDFVALGGWKGAAEKGRVRLEGRDYVMQDGDVVEFMIGS